MCANLSEMQRMEYSVTCHFIFDIPMCGIVSRSARRNRIPLYLVPTSTQYGRREGNRCVPGLPQPS
jgi:hypothetical protein